MAAPSTTSPRFDLLIDSPEAARHAFRCIALAASVHSGRSEQFDDHRSAARWDTVRAIAETGAGFVADCMRAADGDGYPGPGSGLSAAPKR